MPRHLFSLYDLGTETLHAVLARAAQLKAMRGQPAHPRPLAGKAVAILLEKASTRTRLSFEVGIHELGGKAHTLIARDIQLSRGEPVADTGRMLRAYVHAVVFRTGAHARLTTLAQAAQIPVVNGLSDRFHPCQLLADLLTLQQCGGDDLRGRRVAWVGDGNNMAHSWIVAAALTGLDLRLACPPAYQPEAAVIAEAHAAGAQVTLCSDAASAVRDAQVVTTDVWASMGQENEAQRRAQAFASYGVDATLMAQAAPDAIFLHCLPAHRGEEVSAAVIDGPQSRVWQQAENRLHAQKALLEWTLSATDSGAG
ncbi:MAG: ornithine carbamoyltransferase [Polyangiales bacterium]